MQEEEDEEELKVLNVERDAGIELGRHKINHSATAQMGVERLL